MRDLHQSRAALDYPIGGSAAIVDALVRGVEKLGTGKVLLNSHVSGITMENGRAVGVQLRNGKKLRGRRAVISNASIWDTMRLLPAADVARAVSPDYIEAKMATPMTGSFVHLHIGIDATGLPVSQPFLQ